MSDKILKVTKTIPRETFPRDKVNVFDRKVLYFTHFLISYHITIDNLQYLLQLHKILIKSRTFITISGHK